MIAEVKPQTWYTRLTRKRIIAPASGALTVIRLVPTDPTHRKLFPEVVERCMKFIDLVHSDTDKIWLGNLLYSNFFQNTNLVQLLIATNAAGEIVAHNLSYVESRHSLGNVAVLLQLQKDEGDQSITDIGMRLCEEWARSLGIKTILNESATRSRARLWHRYGFAEYRITSRKDLR